MFSSKPSQGPSISRWPLASRAVLFLTLAGCLAEDAPGGGTSSASNGATETGATGKEETVTTFETTGIEEVCGDGIPSVNEFCDDGGENGNYGKCAKNCLEFGPYCGDGEVNGNEECDDEWSENDPVDGCNNECYQDRLVFITEEYFGTNLSGIDGAYQKCTKVVYDYMQTHESGPFGQALEPLSFRAWISNNTDSPSTRFDKGKGRYVLSTGQVIADGWDDLTDGELSHAIDRTIDGKLRNEVAVWTGTKSDGTGYGYGNCGEWTDGNTEKAIYGYSDLTDEGWTHYELGLGTCSNGGSLYCFEARISYKNNK